ncbi:MAG: metallophosphoesterase [Ramlibacter sp.]
MPIYLFSALLHLYVGWRLLPALGPVAQGLLLLVLVASTVLVPLGLLARRHVRGPAADRLALVGLLFMGLFSSLFVLTVLRDVLLLLAVVVFAWRPAALPVAALRDGSALAVPLLALAATALGFWNARRTAAVKHVDVPIANLPAALHGFTVAQITDVHVGPTIKRGYLQAIVTRVNALEADMVAITGDLVDGRVPELAAHVAPLAQLQSRHGSYFVTGNHEYYSGAQAWVTELRRLGLRVLMNEHVVLHHPHGSAHAPGSTPVVVGGVADWSAHHFDPTHKSDPHAAIKGAPPHAAVRLLLAHQPRSAPAAAEGGFDVQLSGHTHGGQFWPWNLFVRLQQPYTAGLHRLRGLWVYTSRGTGYWGPPKRFGAPSEITLLRLVTAA